MALAALPEIDVLGVALAGDHEERPERGHDQEPVRQHDAGGDATGDGPQHETRCHGGQVDDRLVLEPEAVRELDADVDGHHQGQLSLHQEGEQDAGDEQADAHGEGEVDGHDARRHGPVPFGGMQSIGRVVERVVHEVRSAGRHAEDPKGGQGAEERSRVPEHTGRAGRREHQHVLHPLARSRRAQQAGGERAPAVSAPPFLDLLGRPRRRPRARALGVGRSR